MTKSLENILYLKQKLYSFKIWSCKSIEDYNDDFKKIILHLKNVELNIEDKD